MRCLLKHTSIAATVVALLMPAFALAEEEAADKAGASAWPNIYFDFGSTFATSPAGTLALGVRSFPLQTAASTSVLFSAPLSIDVTDRLTIYTGPAWSTSKTSGSNWTPWTPGNWTSGFSFDVISTDATGPTLTVSGGVGRPIGSPIIGGYTTWSGGLNLDYALDDDQTNGWRFDFSFNKPVFRGVTGFVHPTIMTSIGAYHQWDNGWKLTGHLGVQVFRGAEVANLVKLKGATQPFVGFDFERYDDNDNKLFGITMGVGWSPSPSVQLTVSTPLYFVRH
jgi:hypothetical protein